MFDRFTDQARLIVVGAQEEAKRLGHDHIGTEHVLLALAADDDNPAGQFLASQGIGLDAARQAVEDTEGRGVRRDDLLFTPQAAHVLRQADTQARRFGYDAVGPEHILLALIADGGDVTGQVLAKLGTSPARLGEQLSEVTGPPPSAASRVSRWARLGRRG